jgi:hypothetical protein
MAARARYWLALAGCLVVVGYLSTGDDDVPSGHVRCVRGVPTMWIRPGISPAESVLVRRHEEVHIHQATRMGCAAWEQYVVTPEGRLDLETEAYCADVLAFAGSERFVEEAAAEIIGMLLTSRRYRHVASLGRARIEAAVHAACGLAGPRP